MLRKLAIMAALAVLISTLISGCAAQTAQTPSPFSTTNAASATNSGTSPTGVTGTPIVLTPIVVPTMPATVPGYLEIDPETGLHMTGKPITVDFSTYRLKVSGKVDHALSLTYDELRLLPKMTANPPLVCDGFFTDTATWSGVSLKAILDMAGLQPEAFRISLKSADGYASTLNLKEATAPENFLAYELGGKTLPVLQGFPLRAVIPAMNGYVWTKWLVEIVVD